MVAPAPQAPSGSPGAVAAAGPPARLGLWLGAEGASPGLLRLVAPSVAALPEDCCSGPSAGGGGGGVSRGGRGCGKGSGAREHGPRLLAAATAAGPLRSAPTDSSSRRARGVAGSSHADCSLILLSFSQNVNVLLTHTVLGRRLA